VGKVSDIVASGVVDYAGRIGKFGFDGRACETISGGV
jgi:hypothetical protein